jgi:hypothetical protein
MFWIIPAQTLTPGLQANSNADERKAHSRTTQLAGYW